MHSQGHENQVQKILNLSEAFIKAVDTDDRQDMTDTIRPVMERLSFGLFRIVVMGEIKKGKSISPKGEGWMREIKWSM